MQMYLVTYVKENARACLENTLINGHEKKKINKSHVLQHVIAVNSELR